MDVIATARTLGKAIQEDERFIRVINCSHANDENAELQDLIGRFNLRRVDLNNELNKAERDQEKVDALNKEIHEIYDQLMGHEGMVAYNEAKNELDNLMELIMQIIRGSMNGDDPDTIELQAGGCSGSCGSCSGCH